MYFQLSQPLFIFRVSEAESWAARAAPADTEAGQEEVP